MAHAVCGDRSRVTGAVRANTLSIAATMLATAIVQIITQVL
jgi:hypothetical protein